VVEPELDFEAPANENGVSGDCPASSGTQTCNAVPNAELNARLTQRDVILVRQDRNIKVSAEQGGHFDHLLTLRISGQIPVTVTRGWTKVDIDSADSQGDSASVQGDSVDVQGDSNDDQGDSNGQGKDD
jgi:hypothetical protein